MIAGVLASNGASASPQILYPFSVGWQKSRMISGEIVPVGLEQLGSDVEPSDPGELPQLVERPIYLER